MEQIKGKIGIEKGEQGLSLSLLLQLNESGDTWSLPKIENYLEEKGIIEGVSREAISELLKEADSAGEGASLRKEVARGTAPTAPVPNYLEWVEIPLSEEMEREAQRVFANAPAPRITILRTEKVKVKKKVMKKSKLPFLPPKEEIVEAWEKRQSEEEAPINPKVVATGYIEQGSSLAEMQAGEPGKDGRSVEGKPIPPPAPKELEYYPGKGVKLDKNGMVAEKAGFFRRGANWAEILDFRPHSWELSLTKDNATCLFTFTPGDQHASIPSGETVIAKAEEEHGFSSGQLRSSSEVDQLIAKSIQSGKPLDRIPLTGERDAAFSVDISSDNLKGTLTVRKGSGRGKALVLKDVGAAIKASKFVGMDFEKIKNDLLEFYKGKGTELLDYLLAEGEAPTRGEDRELECAVDFLEQTEYEALKQIPSGLASESRYPASTAEKLAKVSDGAVVAVLSSAAEGQPGKDVYGKQIPGIPGIDPHVELLEHVRIEKDRFYAETSGILEVFSNEEGKAIRVRPHGDAKIVVELGDDKMEAYLTIEPPVGTGAPARREQVDDAISQAGIVKGIREDSIAEALEIAGAGSPVRRSVIARGQLPENGSESRLKLLVEGASGKGVSITKSGRADYRNQDRYVTVTEGELLAEIIPDDAVVEDGYDVTGKVISAKDTPQLDLEIGEHIRREEQENKILLYAAVSGEFLFENKKLDILEVHTVSGDVDLSTGNIKFPGTVAISGSVHAGFSIFAEGHVKIAGSVEAALVSSGESVTIAQGVKGGNKAVIRAKSGIETMFIEQATVLAVENVSVKNGCLRSMVKCNGKLRLVGEKGSLIGGVVRARQGVIAADIGNRKGVRTEISFGQDYLVMDRIEMEERELKKLRDKLAALDQSMAGYEKHGQKEGLEKARKEKLKMMKVLEKRGLMLFTLRERFEQHFDASITVRGTIYPGVSVESHGRYWSTDTPKKGVTLHFDQETGHIIEKEKEKETESK